MKLRDVYNEHLSKWPAQDCTDKGDIHDYIDFYGSHFDGNNVNQRLLEIGVYSGASALLWNDYFIDSSITCADIEEGFVIHKDTPVDMHHEIQSCGVDFVWGFNSTRPSSFMMLSGTYDWIIDDGDHRRSSQLETFKAAWPLLKAGGTYFIEDVHSITDAERLVRDIESEVGIESCIFTGKNYPNRWDDIIVWLKKEEH